jgi:hypothetical protein
MQFLRPLKEIWIYMIIVYADQTYGLSSTPSAAQEKMGISDG